MIPTIEVGAAALLSRNIVQWLKTRGHISPDNSLEITVVNFIVSSLIMFLIEISNLVATGTPFSLVVLKGAASAVVAAVYHDLNTFATKDAPPTPQIRKLIPINKVIDPVTRRLV
jgi:hypothetical protein